jgi:hypothetical protein
MRWSGRWDQQHDGMVLMVESIYGQGFAYTRKIKEDLAKELVKLEQENTTKAETTPAGIIFYHWI